MFVRLGSFEVKPGALDALRSKYNAECVPLVKAAAGNLDCFLLEPASGAGPIVACTMWGGEADAKAYESSGSAAAVVGKVREYFAGPPKLESYRVQRDGG